MVDVLFVVVCLNYCFMASLQSALFPAVLLSVEQDFATTNVVMGSMVALYDLVQVLASFPFAALCVRAGTEWSLFVGVMFSVAGALVFSGSGSPLVLALAQVLMGIGSSGITVLCPHFMSQRFPSSGEASYRLSLAYVGVSAGVVIGYVASGIVGTQHWRTLFAANAVILVPVAWSLYCSTRKSSQSSPRVSGVADEEIASKSAPGTTDVVDSHRIDEEDVVAALAVSDAASTWSAIRAVAGNVVIVQCVLCQSSISFGVSALIAFIPKYFVVGLQQSSDTASLLMAITVPATAGGVAISGLLAKTRHPTTFQLLQAIACCCAVSMSLAGMFLVNSVVLFTLLLVVEMFVVFSTMVPAVMVFPSIVDRELVPFANALSNSSLRLLGSVPGPLLLGFLLDRVGTTSVESVQYCYLAVAVLSLVSATIFSIAALRTFASIST